MKYKIKCLSVALFTCLVLTGSMAQGATATDFTASSYPVSLHGEQPAGNLHVWAVGGGEKECETATFTGVMSAAGSSLTITPNYGGAGACEQFGFLGGTAALNGCDYVFHASGTTDIVCPTGKEITTFDNLGICTVHVKPQTGVKGVSYANNGNHIDVTFALTNVHAVVTGAFCPVTPKTYSNSTYNGKITLKGNGGEIKIDVG